MWQKRHQKSHHGPERFRQLSAIFGSYDYQMKGEEYIDQSPWPINWKQNMQGILRPVLRANTRDPTNLTSSGAAKYHNDKMQANGFSNSHCFAGS